MIDDLEIAIGVTGSVGSGRVERQRDGTWLAWIVLDEADIGVYGKGATEGHALSALEAKLKAVGHVASSAFAEAESSYQARKRAETTELMGKLESLLGRDEDTKKTGDEN